MKNLKLFFIVFILFFVYIFLSAKSYSSFLEEDLSNEILRLHIVANSNSAEDQYLKLQIRDNILTFISSFYSSNMNKADVISLLLEKEQKIKEIIQTTISKNGYDYSFSFSITNCSFPTKNYGNITLPLGNYDCLNIELGSSSGENWWCVMFPPACIESSTAILDTTSAELLNQNLNSETYNIIQSQRSSYKIKFKILEIFNSF